VPFEAFFPHLPAVRFGGGPEIGEIGLWQRNQARRQTPDATTAGRSARLPASPASLPRTRAPVLHARLVEGPALGCALPPARAKKNRQVAERQGCPSILDPNLNVELPVVVGTARSDPFARAINRWRASSCPQGGYHPTRASPNGLPWGQRRPRSWPHGVEKQGAVKNSSPGGCGSRGEEKEAARR
jgi:hypothetical protein